MGRSLEKEMATHSSIPVWIIPWTEEPGGLHPWDHKESDMPEELNTHSTHTSNLTLCNLFCGSRTLTESENWWHVPGDNNKLKPKIFF